MLRTSRTMADSYLNLENKEQGTKRTSRKRKRAEEKEKEKGKMVLRNSEVNVYKEEDVVFSLRPNHVVHLLPELEKEENHTKTNVRSSLKEEKPTNSDHEGTKYNSQCRLQCRSTREAQHRKRRTLGCLKTPSSSPLPPLPLLPPPSSCLLWILFFVSVFSRCSASGLVGRLQNCTGEGTQVQLSPELQRYSPCLSCICQKGVVVCDRPKCSSIEGCYHVLFQSKSQCCKQCRGCMFEEKEFNHGSSWSDGCEHHECQSGVLTNSRIECDVPCHNPLPPPQGKCCPICPGCMFEGRLVPEGETVWSRADPCVRCVCSGGRLSCEKRACPVLSCPPALAKLSYDGCCMTCKGSKMKLPLPGGRCLHYRSLYNSGTELEVDPCTICKCLDGYLGCRRKVCPVLKCPRIRQVTERGSCCPVCPQPEFAFWSCAAYGVMRDHGESWRRDECSNCTCHEGEFHCQVQECEYMTKPCPYGFKKAQTPGECCPKCVPRPGVCSVFGDPHYITFDGLLYNFQGTCKYQLVKDCEGGAFDLKVINDPRKSKHFSWTKSLRLQIKGTKIKLGENRRRVKVNKRKIKPPYEKEGFFNITYVGYSISIETSFGLRVLWDGRGYVEVEVSPEWQGKTCGLCGNYNYNQTDDLVTRRGRPARTVSVMANSWATGGGRSCSKKMRTSSAKRVGGVRKPLGGPQCSISKASAVKQCEHLNHTILQECHAVLPVDKYFHSCLLDMCECQEGQRCDCDALLAYTRECERAGISVQGWRKASQCGGLECPRGAVYMPCAPACRPTCQNPVPNPECHKKRCKPGCYCPHPTVLMHGACIDPSECPRRKKIRRRTF
ncbi:BMP-binding endothelial regulator protein-like [Oratosquilla oratoria]|uniref:BMP-binding endothelial regulator protein-like n=1 Tax=Oratosquilla oratoria TaxID=337810 RepID=UPI003F76D89E